MQTCRYSGALSSTLYTDIFFKFGFTQGKEVFLWHFLQGWWYRTLVDAKVFEIKKECGTDKEKIKKFLLINYKINI